MVGRTGALDTHGLRFSFRLHPLTSYVSLGRLAPPNLTSLKCKNEMDPSIAQGCCKHGNKRSSPGAWLIAGPRKKLALLSFLLRKPGTWEGRSGSPSFLGEGGEGWSHRPQERRNFFLQLLRSAMGHNGWPRSACFSKAVIWIYFHILLNRCI